MAKMHPTRLPDRVLNNKSAKGEIETFEALSRLSDEFEIFYNRCPQAMNGAPVFERKIDYIVLHEKHGFLAMEVKGGEIRIGKDGGFEQRVKSWWKSIDPHTQVRLATIDLIMTVKKDGAKYWIPGDMCVMFPNTLRRNITNLPQQLPNNTLFAEDMALLPTQIKTLFSKPRGEKAWVPEAFLDMRRRLQNMPEAQRKDQSAKNYEQTISERLASWNKKSSVKKNAVSATRHNLYDLPNEQQNTIEQENRRKHDKGFNKQPATRIWETSWFPKHETNNLKNETPEQKVDPEVNTKARNKIDVTIPRIAYLKQKQPEYFTAPPDEPAPKPWWIEPLSWLLRLGYVLIALIIFVVSFEFFLWVLHLFKIW